MDKRIQTGLIVLVILVLVHILTEVDLLDKKKMAEVVVLIVLVLVSTFIILIINSVPYG